MPQHDLDQRTSGTVFVTLTPSVFCGLAKVYHTMSTPGMCPSCSRLCGAGNIVFVGSLEEMRFLLNYSSEEGVWFQISTGRLCRLLTPPLETRQIQILLLFWGTEGKPAGPQGLGRPAPYSPVPLEGVGAGRP